MSHVNLRELNEVLLGVRASGYHTREGIAVTNRRLEAICMSSALTGATGSAINHSIHHTHIFCLEQITSCIELLGQRLSKMIRDFKYQMAETSDDAVFDHIALDRFMSILRRQKEQKHQLDRDIQQVYTQISDINFFPMPSSSAFTVNWEEVERNLRFLQTQMQGFRAGFDDIVEILASIPSLFMVADPSKLGDDFRSAVFDKSEGKIWEMFLKRTMGEGIHAIPLNRFNDVSRWLQSHRVIDHLARKPDGFTRNVLDTISTPSRLTKVLNQGVFGVAGFAADAFSHFSENRNVGTAVSYATYTTTVNVVAGNAAKKATTRLVSRILQTPITKKIGKSAIGKTAAKVGIVAIGIKALPVVAGVAVAVGIGAFAKAAYKHIPAVGYAVDSIGNGLNHIGQGIRGLFRRNG